jgi:hypothetical protein
MGVPGGAEPREGLGGQRDGALFGPLAPRAIDLEALAGDGKALEEEGLMKPAAHARDGGAGDLGLQGGGRLEEPPDLRDPAASGKTVGSRRAEECEGVPVAREDVRRDEAEATGAEAHGRWGEAIAVCAVQARALQLLCGEAVGGWVGALRSQTDCPDRGCLRPFALPAALESREHVLTEGSHTMPCF